MRDDGERLLDILEAIEKIERRSAVSQSQFMRDELIQVWLIHHLQIIGEAAARISAVTRDRYPHIPWQDITAMRNVLVHQYFGIDLQEVWDTVHIDLPKLKCDLESVLKDLQ